MREDRLHSADAVLGRDDVVSTFAGLRPLLASDAASTSATSREHDIWVDDHGVLTLAGGKLTTMRKMAEQAVDRLVELLRERGVEFTQEPEDRFYGTDCALRDPFGNPIRITEPVPEPVVPHSA